MRHFTSRILVLGLLACIPLVAAWSAESLVSREKKETFRFSKIKANATLNIGTEFGSLTIVPWDKDEILLERKQTVKASTAENARKKIESRVVKTKIMGNTYYMELETLPGNLPKDTYNMEDDWTVYVPKNKLSFDVRNRYGNVTFTNDLRCPFLTVDVEFGNVYLLKVQAEKFCLLQVKHGVLNIDRINRATLQAPFTNVCINQAEELKFSVSFGNLDVKRLGRGTGKSEHGNLYVSSLEHGLWITECKYGWANITLSNAKAFEGLTINSSFTNVNLSLADKICAGYQLESKFGNVYVDSHAHNTYEQEGGPYTGFTTVKYGYVGGTSEPKAKIVIKAEHGNISVMNK